MDSHPMGDSPASHNIIAKSQSVAATKEGEQPAQRSYPEALTAAPIPPTSTTESLKLGQIDEESLELRTSTSSLVHRDASTVDSSNVMTLQNPREVSPPPQILSVKKVQHTKPQRHTDIVSKASKKIPVVSLSQIAQLNRSELKRTMGAAGEQGAKRQKVNPSAQRMPTQGFLATPQSSSRNPLLWATPPHDPSRNVNNTSGGTLGEGLLPETQRIPSSNIAVEPHPGHGAHQSVLHQENTALPRPGRAVPQEQPRHWTARGWTARQYYDLAEMTEKNFPLEAYCQKHKKTPVEVAEVFRAIIRTPFLAVSDRIPGRPRGGLGEQLVKDYKADFKTMYKESIENCRKEEEQDQKDDLEEEKRIKEGRQNPLCNDCKQKRVGRPDTIDEARAQMKAALSEANKAVKAYHRMVDSDQKKREGSQGN